MRIIGGKWRGKHLSAPPDERVRPTTDRVRENLFNVLAHAPWAPEIAEARVLDLFAGTGALGLEALSRGAAFCLFVDDHPASRALARQNVEACNALGVSKIFKRDATRLGALPANAGGPFDLVFADAPYRSGLGAAALEAAQAGGWLAADAVCVLELDAAEDLALPPAFTEHDRRRYGDTVLVFAGLARASDA